MVAETLLELYAVTIGYGHVVHVHTKHQAAYVTSVGNTYCHASPNGNFLLSLFALPVAANHLAGNTHTGADMTELNITVSTLVQVHEVHIHRFPGDFSVKLSVEVEKRFLQSLQALNPHLGRRESVHPCDDTNALFLVVGSLHHVFHFLRTVGCTFIYYLYGNVSTIVQAIHHFLRVGVNLYNGVTSIKQLCTSHPPNLIVIKCFHNCMSFI